jgi:hypothetical protein
VSKQQRPHPDRSERCTVGMLFLGVSLFLLRTSTMGERLFSCSSWPWCCADGRLVGGCCWLKGEKDLFASPPSQIRIVTCVTRARDAFKSKTGSCTKVVL